MSTMFQRYGRGALAAGAVAILVACNTEIAPQVEITGFGSLEGFIFFDASEDGIFDPADGDFAIQDVDFEVRNRGTESVLATATSNVTGRFLIDDLPLGTHDLQIDTLTVPSGVSICRNPLLVSVFLDNTQFQIINGRPGCLITIQAVKDLALGEFVIVQGIVTSAPGQIEANFVYIEDATAGLFLFASALMGQGIEVGDRIEVGGTSTIFSGQFQLSSVALRPPIVKAVAVPVPRLVTTAEIGASGGDPRDDLQNRFVRVVNVRLLEAFTASGNEQNSTIDDGSGGITIRVDDGVVTPRSNLDNIFTPGACYDINGFAANFFGGGQIFPRSLDDIVEVTCN